MSPAAEVLAELRSLGFEARPNGNQVRLCGPVHALTPALRARVVAARAELLALLGQRPKDANPERMAPLAETGPSRGHSPKVAKGEGLATLEPPRGDGSRTGLAVREVLSVRAAWLADPVAFALPFDLVVAVPGIAGVVHVTFGRRAGPHDLDAGEWVALAEAAEHGRARPTDLATWCARKRREPGWRLPVVGGTADATMTRSWTVGRVLERLGAGLRAVVIEGGNLP